MSGPELRTLRKTTGLSREKFARIIDRAAGTVYRWERGMVLIDPLVATGIRARVAAFLDAATSSSPRPTEGQRPAD